MTTQLTKPQNWMTVLELRDYVKTKGRHWSRTYVQFLVANGKLPSFKISSARIFLKEEVDAFLNTLTRNSPPVLIKKKP